MTLAFVVLLAAKPVTLEWRPFARPTLTYNWERSGRYGSIYPVVKMTLTRQVLDSSKPEAIQVKETLVLVDEWDGFPGVANKPPFERTNKVPPHTETWRVTRKADGECLMYDPRKEPHWTDEDVMSDPLFDIIYPDKPVQKGQTWTYHTTDVTSDRTTDFTYVGADKVGKVKCNKVSVSFHAIMNNGEAGGKMSGSGTYWLDAKDGAVVKSDLELNEHREAPLSFHEVISRKE